MTKIRSSLFVILLLKKRKNIRKITFFLKEKKKVDLCSAWVEEGVILRKSALPVEEPSVGVLR